MEQRLIMETDLIDINLKHLKPYILNNEYTDIFINEEGNIICKKFTGEKEFIKDQKLTKKYLQGLFRLIAISSNKDIYDIDNCNEDLEIACGGEIHRANVIFGDLRKNGFGVAIRLKRNHSITLDDFIISKENKNNILNIVQNGGNILISAGTGTGKTTFLNCLLEYIKDKDNTRIVTIENVSEIDVTKFRDNYSLIYQQNEEKEVIKAYNTSLRVHPDIIILGEIRKENAKIFLSCINSGHKSSFSTVHASSPKDSLTAIANYITAQHLNENKEEVIREMQNNLSCVIQLEKTFIHQSPQVIVKEVVYFK